MPVVGAAVAAEGKSVGRVTSATWSPALGRPIAMAIVHRDYTSPGSVVTIDGVHAVVASLPIRKRLGHIRLARLRAVAAGTQSLPGYPGSPSHEKRDEIRVGFWQFQRLQFSPGNPFHFLTQLRHGVAVQDRA